MYLYRRLKSKKFNQSRLYTSQEVMNRADKVLQQFEEGSIGVRVNDQKTMALYIDTFAGEKHDALLDKLQKSAIFDVRRYLTDSRRTMWQKLFRIYPHDMPEISATSLNRRVKQYNSINKKLADGWYHKDELYQTQYCLEAEAKDYASAFLDDKLNVVRHDVPALRQYFTAFSNQNNADKIADAINKIDNTSLESYAEKRPSKIKRFFATIKSGWNKLSGKHQNDSARIIGMKPKNIFKAAAVAALFIITGGAVLKSDSLAKTPKQNKVEVKQKKAPSAQKQDNLIKTDAFKTKSVELTHEQKIWKNFYDTKNEIHAADAKVDLQQLYKSIERQQAAGIFTMPENISIERFAYTHLIYEAYGLQSPLDAAINGKQKLSQAQQKAMEEAIETAGTNGIGVKKIALSYNKRMGRTLGSHSAFDRASDSQKHKYMINLKEVRKLHQRGA